MATAGPTRPSPDHLSPLFPFSMTSPSFPPIDDLAAWLRSLDLVAIASAVIGAAMIAAAVIHVLAVKLAPYIAAWLRLLADRLDVQAEPPTIKSLAAAGLGQRAIAARLGITRHQVRRALA
jgi:hypothetical protein